MIGQLLDHAIGVFAPATAARRVHAREAYRRLSKRSYDAAKRDRTNANWFPVNRSADLELLSDAKEIRARARDLVRNNAYARGILRAICRNTVGVGIKPQARTPDEMVNVALEELFDRWQKSADITGRLSFYEIQRLAMWEVAEAGEVLIHFVESRDRSRPLPLAIELIEADRIADEYLAFRSKLNPDTGNEIRRGIEVDATGVPVAYWLYPSHPNDINTWNTTPQRMPAENFVHLFKVERIGQTRGVSAFAPLVSWLKNLHYYVDNELQASAVASCFTAAIKTMGGPNDLGLSDTLDSDSSDTDGNQFEYLQPGMIARLLPGEEVDVINPSRPNAQADAWINLMLRSMAVGAGLSYERLTRDYSQTNYSSNRASDLEDRREFRTDQQWMITHLCEPVWRRFVISAVQRGMPDMPSRTELLAEFDAWQRHIWQPPGWEWVDPLKEVQASIAAIDANLSTLSDEHGKRGNDWRSQLEQRAKEEAAKLELGLEKEEAEEPEEAEAMQ